MTPEESVTYFRDVLHRLMETFDHDMPQHMREYISHSKAIELVYATAAQITVAAVKKETSE